MVSYCQQWFYLLSLIVNISIIIISIIVVIIIVIIIIVIVVIISINIIITIIFLYCRYLLNFILPCLTWRKPQKGGGEKNKMETSPENQPWQPSTPPGNEDRSGSHHRPRPTPARRGSPRDSSLSIFLVTHLGMEGMEINRGGGWWWRMRTMM